MKNILTIALVLTCGHCFGQNLVANPSFEQHTLCPTGSNQLNYSLNWSSFGNSPDYFHSCATTLGMGTPNAMWGYQVPHSGEAYSSVVTYSANADYREIIGNTLASNLLIGEKYFFSFYVNFAFEPLSAGLASNKIGLRFSTTPYSGINPAPINNFAHFYCDSILSDTLLWVKISGSFIADSAYAYLAIGNFFLDSLTDTLHVGTALPVYSMYYIDDVCVSTDSIYNELWTGVENIGSASAFANVFPNPFSNQLNISVSGNEQTTVSLYNTLGQQVLQQTFITATTISTEQLAGGIYFYELRNNKGAVMKGKVLKQ